MQKPIGMKYGKQVEEASLNIATSGDHDSDRWIRPLITLQSVISRFEDSYSSLLMTQNLYQTEIQPLMLKVDHSYFN